jgi:hypothetical protein
MFTGRRPAHRVTTMRDGSMEDMASFWIGRVMEKSDWTTSSEIYLALIRHAAQKYLEANTCPHFGPTAVAELEKQLTEILAKLPKPEAGQPVYDTTDRWMTPLALGLSHRNPEQFEQRYAYYWTTNMWRRDFLTALENQFWVYRDYAHGAGKGKMAFLRELAEVWIAAATTALVRYADNDKRTWRNTAKMLRQHADMVEADGLRALPWGHWGYSRTEAQSNVDPEVGDGIGRVK